MLSYKSWFSLALIAGLTSGCGSSGGSTTTSDSGSSSDTGTTSTSGDSAPTDAATATDSGAGETSTESGSCAGGPCTGAHMTCDPADGKCKLDGTTSNVGGTCDTSGADPKCGSDTKATCNDLTNDGFPGGYCSFEPCSTTALCPIGASCAHLGGEANVCWKNCNTDSDCRSPDYGCFDISPLYTSGASHKVCYLKTFACNTNADCPAIKPTCTGASDAGTGTCG